MKIDFFCKVVLHSQTTTGMVFIFFLWWWQNLGGNSPLFLLNTMCPLFFAHYLNKISIKAFESQAESNQLSENVFWLMNWFDSTFQKNKWVISWFESTFRKSCWVMSRFESNFWKKLLSRELIRLNFQNFQFDSNPKKLSQTQVWQWQWHKMQCATNLVAHCILCHCHFTVIKVIDITPPSLKCHRFYVYLSEQNQVN